MPESTTSADREGRGRWQPLALSAACTVGSLLPPAKLRLSFDEKAGGSQRRSLQLLSVRGRRELMVERLADRAATDDPSVGKALLCVRMLLASEKDVSSERIFRSLFSNAMPLIFLLSSQKVARKGDERRPYLTTWRSFFPSFFFWFGLDRPS